MPQIPSVQPFDVFTPLAAAGQATATAFKDVGTSVDTYNRMDQALKDKNARRAIRTALIQEAGLDDSALPPDMSGEDLAKLANKIKAAKDVIGEVIENGGPKAIPSTSEKRLIALAAGATDDAFWRAVGATQDAVAAYKKEKEGTTEGQRLQDVSTGLQNPAGEIPLMPSPITGGPQSPASQQQRDITSGTQSQAGAKSGYAPNLISREGAYKAVSKAGIDVEKVGKERMRAFEKQYQPEEDLKPKQFAPPSETAHEGVALKRQSLAAEYQRMSDALRKEVTALEQYRQNPKANVDKLVGDGYLSAEQAALDEKQVKPIIESLLRDKKTKDREYMDQKNMLLGYPKGTGYLPMGWWDEGIASALREKYPDFDKKTDKEKKKLMEEYKRTGGKGGPASAAAPAPGAEQPLPVSGRVDPQIEAGMKAMYDSSGGKPGFKSWEQYRDSLIKQGMYGSVIKSYRQSIGR